MKKLIKVVLGLIVMSVLFTSCGAESDVLSQFSKRKYLKKSKANKQYELAVTEELVVNENKSELEPIAAATKTNSVKSNDAPLQKEPLIMDEVVAKTSSNEISTKKDLKDWDAYNRAFNAMPTLVENGINQKASSHAILSSQRASEVVLVILCIFLPPVAVILYEDTVTGNFWLDLVLTLLFWIPGLVYAFLVCFAGVSI